MDVECLIPMFGSWEKQQSVVHSYMGFGFSLESNLCVQANVGMLLHVQGVYLF